MAGLSRMRAAFDVTAPRVALSAFIPLTALVALAARTAPPICEGDGVLPTHS